MKKILTLVFAAALFAACSEKPFVVVQIADSQLGFDAAIKAQAPGAEYVNDLTYEIGYLEKAVAYVNEIKPDVVVFSGDQVNLHDNQEQWNKFTEIISAIDKSVKVLHVPGNHDVIVNGNQVDTTPFSSRFGEDHFEYCEKGVTLIGINTNLIKYDDPRESEQFEWCRTALEKSCCSEVALVFGHHPFFGVDIDEEDGYFQLQKSKRRQYFDMFAENGVKAVYAGHLHNSRVAEYAGITMTTTTSVAYQLGEALPSVRVITVENGTVTDQVHNL